MPSNHLILCRPLLLLLSIFPSIRIFSIESVSSHWVAKVNASFIRWFVPWDILTTPFSQASIEIIPNFLFWKEVFSVGSTVRFHRVTPLSASLLKYGHCRLRSFCRDNMAPRTHQPHQQRASSRGKASSWSVSNQEPASLGAPVNLASPRSLMLTATSQAYFSLDHMMP